MKEVIVNYEFDYKDRIVLVNDIEYVPRELLEEVIRDRRRIAMDNAKLNKDMADMIKTMRNAKNNINKVRETTDIVRLKPFKVDLEKKVYPSWAFTEYSEEKRRINADIYNRLIQENKIGYNYKAKELYDLVLEVDYEPNMKEYTVHKNKNKLTADEIALIVDNGNLCFGYTGDERSGKVWID